MRRCTVRFIRAFTGSSLLEWKPNLRNKIHEPKYLVAADSVLVVFKCMKTRIVVTRKIASSVPKNCFLPWLAHGPAVSVAEVDRQVGEAGRVRTQDAPCLKEVLLHG